MFVQDVFVLNYNFYFYSGYESDKGEAESIDNIGDSSDSWSTTSDAVDDAHKNGLK
jgi:hypothetical protein